mmetsp:Transcript_39852/g.29404  ORF Transcript_39852/g.29404 Transcript_39852/m.29404 type:complete len:92 (-) Transcript_39852:44-319(-)
MDIINELYKPTHLLLPIGGHFTMGPEEAGYAVAKFLKHAHTVIPMHFATFPLLYGTIEDFQKHLAKFSAEFHREEIKIIDPHSMLEKSTPI